MKGWRRASLGDRRLRAQQQGHGVQLAPARSADSAGSQDHLGGAAGLAGGAWRGGAWLRLGLGRTAEQHPLPGRPHITAPHNSIHSAPQSPVEQEDHASAAERCALKRKPATAAQQRTPQPYAGAGPRRSGSSAVSRSSRSASAATWRLSPSPPASSAAKSRLTTGWLTSRHTCARAPPASPRLLPPGHLPPVPPERQRVSLVA